MYRELEEIPLFEGLKPADLGSIAGYIYVQHYKRNECILQKGARNRHFCIVKKGRLKISCTDEAGHKVLFCLLGEGDFFGEMSLLEREGCSASVYSLQASDIYCIRDIHFKRLLTQIPGLAYALLNHMSQRLRHTDRCVEYLNCRNSLQRVGKVILDLAEFNGYRYKRSVIIKKMPFQHDIAALAGTSRETVSRHFADFEESGMIKKSGRYLVINDYSHFYDTFSS